jgi:hypothetical protein
MLFFKMKHLLFWLIVNTCLISMAVIFYFKFDVAHSNNTTKDRNHLPIPLFVLVTPFAVLLLATAIKQVWDIVYETDYATIVLYGYNSKIKLVLTVISSLSTVTYIITMMPSIYLIQKLQESDTEDILEFVLIASLVYTIVMMEGVGSMVLDIMFE